MPPPVISAVVPVFNKRAFVRACAAALVAAAEERDDVEVVFVDHQSTDGSYEEVCAWAERHPGVARVVRQPAGGTISGVRNAGVRAARGDVLAFVDSDVVVPPGFFGRVLEVLAESGAAAVGCEYDVPEGPHWSERVWYELHVIRADGDRHFLNGGDLVVRRDALAAVAGWAEHLAVGEDTELCTRLRAAGYRIFESQRLRAVHLGNPKSVRAFYRKQVWHGASSLDDPSLVFRNKVTLMAVAFGVLAAAAAGVLAAPSPLGIRGRLAAAAALVLAVPAAAVAYRVAETRRVVDPPRALLLYLVYFAARARALAGAAVTRRRAAAQPGGVSALR